MLYPVLSRRAPSLFADDLFSAGQSFDRVFNNGLFQPLYGGNETWSASPTWMPAVDVYETDAEYRLLFEVPGIDPADIDVTVQGDMLTVRGEGRSEQHEGKEVSNYTIRERRYGSFERSYRLPEGVDSEKLAAHCENGILNLSLPKAKSARARRIEIASGGGATRIGSGQAT